MNFQSIRQLIDFIINMRTRGGVGECGAREDAAKEKKEERASRRETGGKKRVGGSKSGGEECRGKTRMDEGKRRATRKVGEIGRA